MLDDGNTHELFPDRERRESAGLLAMGDLERRRKKYELADTHFKQAL